MALNPFFLQGSQSEQRLVQDIINEHLLIYGVEVTYIPRKYVSDKSTIMEEVTASKFDDNFLLEAYVNTYEGYGGQGDVMTKFGVSIKDEITLTISKERFEDFISPFLEVLPDDEIEVYTRPREGDLIYFPLGSRLFEVMFVEHEDPFYQLGKNYVYQLKCELFEYEDEVIDTSIDEIDKTVEDIGFITTLQLIGSGTTATANAQLSQPSGYIRELTLTNDGSGFTATPTVAISTAPAGGVNASAVAITTTRTNITSVEKLILTNAGSGYTTPPIITIYGGGGTGAAATCLIEPTQKGVITFTMTDEGIGYGAVPTVTVEGLTAGGVGMTTALGEAIRSADNKITSIRVTDPGIGYTGTPTVTISNPSTMTGIGTYDFGELVTGHSSGCEGRVKSWDKDTKILKVSNVGIGTTVNAFTPGELIVGYASSATYSVGTYDNRDIYDKYDTNDEFEAEADLIVDFTQSNPFGTY